MQAGETRRENCFSSVYRQLQVDLHRLDMRLHRYRSAARPQPHRRAPSVSHRRRISISGGLSTSEDHHLFSSRTAHISKLHASVLQRFRCATVVVRLGEMRYIIRQISSRHEIYGIACMHSGTPGIAVVSDKHVTCSRLIL